MVKKILCCILLIASYAYADLNVEARVGAFFPVNSRFQDIYGYVGPAYEIQLSKQFMNNIDYWVNVDWYTKSGKSIGFKDSTRINILNFSFGFAYLWGFTCHDDLYIGLGPVFSDLWLKNHSRCTPKRVSEVVFGGVLKLGYIHRFCNCFFLDLFVDYYYQPVHFDTRVDVGGVRTGLGLGYSF